MSMFRFLQHPLAMSVHRNWPRGRVHQLHGNDDYDEPARLLSRAEQKRDHEARQMAEARSMGMSRAVYRQWLKSIKETR
jgi:hypothetical protein